jgi:glycosyltransferase involved in cell wall biosynthesis
VEALAELKKTMPAGDYGKIKFRLYGDGPALEEIITLAEKSGIADKVRYMGYLQPEEMRKEVLKANLLILPPLKNIYSDLFYTIKLIETIYLKIPVIATRLNTYKRYYREDSLFYFDSGSITGLAEKIQEVFYNKELVKTKVDNARSDYDKIGWDVMKQRYLDIIKNIL